MNMHIESEILSYRPEQLHQSTQAMLAEITRGIEIPHGVGRKFRARKAKLRWPQEGARNKNRINS